MGASTIADASVTGFTMTISKERDINPAGLGPTSPVVSITRYGSRNFAVWLDGELLAVTLYLKGAKAVASALTKLSTHDGKEGNYVIKAA